MCLVFSATLQTIANKNCCSTNSQSQTFLFSNYTNKKLIKNFPLGTIISIRSKKILSRFFDKDGKGMGDYLDWYICDGRNGTPDLRFKYRNFSDTNGICTDLDNSGTNNEKQIIAYIIFFKH